MVWLGEGHGPVSEPRGQGGSGSDGQQRGSATEAGPDDGLRGRTQVTSPGPDGCGDALGEERRLVGEPDEIRGRHLSHQPTEGGQASPGVEHDKEPEATQLAMPERLVGLVSPPAKVLLVSQDLGGKVPVASPGTGHSLGGHVHLQEEEECLALLRASDGAGCDGHGGRRCIGPRTPSGR